MQIICKSRILLSPSTPTGKARKDYLELNDLQEAQQAESQEYVYTHKNKYNLSKFTRNLTEAKKIKAFSIYILINLAIAGQKTSQTLLPAKVFQTHWPAFLQCIDQCIRALKHAGEAHTYPIGQTRLYAMASMSMQHAQFHERGSHSFTSHNPKDINNNINDSPTIRQILFLPKNLKQSINEPKRSAFIYRQKQLNKFSEK